jgi:glycosyltransferase involved in cell wall biosynthesis
MVRVFVPKPGEDWVCDKIIDEFVSKTRHTIVTSLYEVDVVWFYAKWIADRFKHLSHVMGQKPCLTSVFHIVPGKEFDVKFFDSFTSVYHVPNAFTRAQLAALTNTPIRQLGYWPLSEFGPLSNSEVDDFCCRSMLDNKRYVFGSFQRDTEGATIRTNRPQPKLEKGPDILAAVLEHFRDDDYRMLLGGWRRQYIKSMIPRQKLIDMSGDDDRKGLESLLDVNRLYNVLRRHKGIYLVTSRYEGGPQSILEAAAVGTKILSTTMGVAPDVLHPDCLCGPPDDPQTIQNFVKKIREGVDWDAIIEHNSKRAKELSVDIMVSRYDDLIDDVYVGRVK